MQNVGVRDGADVAVYTDNQVAMWSVAVAEGRTGR